ncbi:universal stress protein [Lentzea sp. BCCO 10_0798]|uniref:Universal stress protein n=1 Tax=Lentzea kristufekii TaxID=3095430 RepID=A0ABU4U7B9_9PSEU|nr:universal stress protein [Lentzea sp. BCCO 10_0798]MDX8056499.1 universal stress protein [Lentzea sp. BCCO 10_0798]
MTVTRPVVVGLDGSKSATRAVRWAAEEAVRRNTGLVITHSCALLPARTLDVIAPAESYADGVLEESRQWLTEAAGAARKAAPQVEVKTELAAGDAAEQLIGRSTSAGLLVLGSHGRGGFAGLLAGSTAVAVTTHAHCPVVVVRNTDADPASDAPVVVGLDGSPASYAALDIAFEAAALRRVPLRAVRTWWDLTAETAWQRGLTATNLASIEAAEHRLLAEQVAARSAAHPDVPVQQILTRDRPAHTLIKQSAHAQLIVVGTRGRGGFRGLLLGSTSQALIHHAHCPVSVVPLTQR